MKHANIVGRRLRPSVATGGKLPRTALRSSDLDMLTALGNSDGSVLLYAVQRIGVLGPFTCMVIADALIRLTRDRTPPVLPPLEE